MARNDPKRLRISTANGEFEINADGRPDGEPSMLEKYAKERDRLLRDDEPFALNEEAVQQLSEEALLYRLRREYFFHIEDYPRARRDVSHGISIIEFIHDHADDPEQQQFYWQFRADQEIFLRVNDAHALMKAKDFAGARRELDEALTYVSDFYAEWHSTEAEEALGERQAFLTKKYQEIGQAWENEPGTLANTAPALEDQLAAAVEAEDYERAAVLRDEIRAQAAGGA